MGINSPVSNRNNQNDNVLHDSDFSHRVRLSAGINGHLAT